ncbi:DUF5955 family protein [Streptomyces sp. NPDC015232]|uniref:DUF5955 family protein n=1 Tax=unclassified Streptomyces TaxID=2593676 RepID=UPI0036F84E99
MVRSVGQRRVTGRVTADGVDPRVSELRAAVSRLRRELAGHPREFAERGIAEDELAALDAMAAGGAPEVWRLRRSLLLVAGALGSVSALAEALAQVRHAVDLFGPPPVPPARDGRDPQA